MFTIDTTIDTVQTGKKQFVKTFVLNEPIAKALTNFIDAQTEYTKKAAKVAVDTTTTVAQETLKLVQETSKINYSKFGEEFTKMFNIKY